MLSTFDLAYYLVCILPINFRSKHDASSSATFLLLFQSRMWLRVLVHRIIEWLGLELVSCTYKHATFPVQRTTLTLNALRFISSKKYCIISTFYFVYFCPLQKTVNFLHFLCSVLQQEDSYHKQGGVALILPKYLRGTGKTFFPTFVAQGKDIKSQFSASPLVLLCLSFSFMCLKELMIRQINFQPTYRGKRKHVRTSVYNYIL